MALAEIQEYLKLVPSQAQEVCPYVTNTSPLWARKVNPEEIAVGVGPFTLYNLGVEMSDLL